MRCATGYRCVVSDSGSARLGSARLLLRVYSSLGHTQRTGETDRKPPNEQVRTGQEPQARISPAAMHSENCFTDVIKKNENKKKKKICRTS